MSRTQTVVAGRYRLLRQLGVGGMGRVWLARDEMLGRDVAVKEIVPPAGLSPRDQTQTRLRILREARTAARLNHPNVVKIYDVVQFEELPWIVMEYVPSRSLQDVITEDGPLEPAHAARIGLAVLAALTAAHRAGVLHRDVKPGNVLLAPDGRVVLTDFGLATFDGEQNALTMPGLVMGSVRYIPPERARDGTATTASDLWSLGATLYAAVEGRSPYARTSALATLTALATSLPDPPRRAGPLKGVLAGLLRRNPRARLGPDEVRRMLQRVAAGGGRARWAPRPRRPSIVESAAASPGSASPEPASPSPYPGMPVDGLVLADAVVAMEAVGTGEVPTTVLDSGAPPRDGPPPLALRDATAPSARRWLLGGVLAALALALVSALAATAVDRAGRAAAPAPSRPAGSARPGPSVPASGPAGVVQPDPVLRDAACPTAGATAFAPASQGSGWYGLLPGWVWYRDPAGYRLAAPQGWRVYRGPRGLCFREPGGGRVLGVMTWQGGNALAQSQARAMRTVTEVRPDRYQLVRQSGVPYYRAGADWEFRFVDGAGTPMHADARDFLVAPGRGYTIVWCTKDFDWGVNQDYFLMILASFTVDNG